MTALIEAEGLSRRFGGIAAVDRLAFAVAPGELVGPNGSGKTTTINLLTGHLAPSAGRILLRGAAPMACRPTGSPPAASGAPSRSPSSSAA